ncbi:MAG: hypothetical protein WC325_11365, partial [Candidatus Bathyarchaeia archaeon]
NCGGHQNGTAKGIRWTQEETALLQTLHSSHKVNQLLKYFPRHNYNAIKNKRYHMGLRVRTAKVPVVELRV